MLTYHSQWASDVLWTSNGRIYEVQTLKDVKECLMPTGFDYFSPLSDTL